MKLKITIQENEGTAEVLGTSLTFFEDFVLVLDGSHEVARIEPDSIVSAIVWEA